MKPHKIVREFTDYIAGFEMKAIVEQLTFEDYKLTIYVDDSEIKCLSMGSLWLCKQYTYWFVEWANEITKVISRLLWIR